MPPTDSRSRTSRRLPCKPKTTMATPHPPPPPLPPHPSSTSPSTSQCTTINDPKRVFLRRDSSSYNIFRASHGRPLDGLLLFPEQPRQIFVLSLVVATISYYSFTHDSPDVAQNGRNALYAAVLVFLVYCFLQTKDGLLTRPHPGVWRVVHGCSVVYLLFLAAMLVQNRQSAVHAMQLVFPEVGSRLERGGNQQGTAGGTAVLQCAMNYEALKRGVSSIWFFAHMTGWWGKMCMFRDWRFCWVLSIAFELLELALQFVIPDFKECWWDSLLLDMLGANLLGMCLGRVTLWLLESKEYDWSGRRGKKLGYFRLALNQFTPFQWEQYHWEVFSSFKRFAEIVFAMMMCLVTELNAFFMLTTLSIPKESSFNSYRLFLMFMIGIPAASEYYEFITNPKCWRLGQNSWMVLSIAIFEVLVWIKFSADGVLFTQPPPDLVMYPILTFAVMFSVWMVLFFRNKPPQPASRRSRRLVTGWGYLDVLFWASFTPLVFLASQWAF